MAMPDETTSKADTTSDTEGMHTGDETTDVPDVAEGNDSTESDEAAPLRKVKGEAKRLRGERNAARASAAAAWQIVAETVLAAETNVADPAALLARLKPVHDYVAEDNSLKRDELVADANEFMKAIKPRGRRGDPDQGKGHGHTDDETFGGWMRRARSGS
jgi:hypothetical protein